MKVSSPVVKEIVGLTGDISEYKEQFEEKDQKLIFDYPVVYIHNWKDNEINNIYVGETNNIVYRTTNHYNKIEEKNAWQSNMKGKEKRVFLVGHEHFNKSLTLDIENRLILYMSSLEKIKTHNGRGNPQRDYYPSKEMETIFTKIWRKLHHFDKELFPIESKIKDSAIFKASPFHKLTVDQEMIKFEIINKVFSIIGEQEENKVIFVEGEAGTGKTVLNSSTFYEMFLEAKEKNIYDFKCFMIVNHDEQKRVYSQIVQNLGLNTEYQYDLVMKPTSFINKYNKENPVDIVFIDEAHLLLTQGKQSYTGKNQLLDIIDRSKITVVMFDINQVLTTEQYWDEEIINKIRDKSIADNNYFKLDLQLRMNASENSINWIKKFTKEQVIESIPLDEKYEIKIFSSPEEMEKALEEKRKIAPLTRMVATYDWEYDPNNPLSEKSGVKIGNWKRAWNYEIATSFDKKQKRNLKNLAWAEQEHTFKEIGSTFTIQGFDLSYVGVILGKSVKFEDGKIKFDASEKKYNKMTRRRTLLNGEKKSISDDLISNEISILMSRGVKGLYIYACDDNLREKLLEAQNKKG